MAKIKEDYRHKEANQKMSEQADVMIKVKLNNYERLQNGVKEYQKDISESKAKLVQAKQEFAQTSDAFWKKIKASRNPLKKDIGNELTPVEEQRFGRDVMAFQSSKAKVSTLEKRIESAEKVWLPKRLDNLEGVKAKIESLIEGQRQQKEVEKAEAHLEEAQKNKAELEMQRLVEQNQPQKPVPKGAILAE